jgi:hypothetical protein
MGGYPLGDVLFAHYPVATWKRYLALSRDTSA